MVEEISSRKTNILHAPLTPSFVAPSLWYCDQAIVTSTRLHISSLSPQITPLFLFMFGILICSCRLYNFLPLNLLMCTVSIIWKQEARKVTVCSIESWLLGRQSHKYDICHNDSVIEKVVPSVVK